MKRSREYPEYFKNLRSQGRSAFTIKEASRDLGVSENALKCHLYKLRKKGEIVSPSRGFYILVLPEFQALGSLPAPDLIPLLMAHLKLDYYVCLLSAASYQGASYQGASHQAVQVFQVMVEKQLPPIVLGKIRIEFIYKKILNKKLIQKITAKTGYLNISSPELTLMDLLIYPHRAGGLNHVATVLSELIEAVDPKKLLELFKDADEKSWIQRLGYILEKIEPDDIKKKYEIIELAHAYLEGIRTRFFALDPRLSAEKKSRNKRWKIIENITIEGDI